MTAATVLYGVGYAVWLLVAPTPAPVQYTAHQGDGPAVLTYDPARGWVGSEACPWGCYSQAGQEHWLLRGQFAVSTLADLGVTIRRDGVPIVQCYRLFTQPVCE